MFVVCKHVELGPPGRKTITNVNVSISRTLRRSDVHLETYTKRLHTLLRKASLTISQQDSSVH